MEEIWAPVGIIDGYEVSSAGRVRNASTLKFIKPSSSGCGYLKVGLYNNGKVRQINLHRLVALVFLDKTGDVVNHKNGIKTDNCVSNLEWTTRSANELHSRYVLHNLVKPVCSMSPSGEVVEFFASINATELAGFLPKRVAICCYKEWKTHKGLFWRFVDPQDKNRRKKSKAAQWSPQSGAR